MSNTELEKYLLQCESFKVADIQQQFNLSFVDVMSVVNKLAQNKRFVLECDSTYRRLANFNDCECTSSRKESMDFDEKILQWLNKDKNSIIDDDNAVEIDDDECDDTDDDGEYLDEEDDNDEYDDINEEGFSENIEEKAIQAIDVCSDLNYISLRGIVNRCSVGYNMAYKIMQWLIVKGFVQRAGSTLWKLTVSKEELDRLRKNHAEKLSAASNKTSANNTTPNILEYYNRCICNSFVVSKDADEILIKMGDGLRKDGFIEIYLRMVDGSAYITDNGSTVLYLMTKRWHRLSGAEYIDRIKKKIKNTKMELNNGELCLNVNAGNIFEKILTLYTFIKGVLKRI